MAGGHGGGDLFGGGSTSGLTHLAGHDGTAILLEGKDNEFFGQ